MSSVIVVDDEAAMRHLMTRWAQAAGHTATSASSAEEALDVMAQTSTDVAVCDVRMPGHDGIWLAGRIRQDFPDTAVIMATAAVDSDPKIAEENGAVDFLFKPFDRDRLRYAIDRGIDWHNTASSRREWVGKLTADLHSRREAFLAALASRSACDAAASVEAIAALLGDTDPSLLEHSRRVASRAVQIGAALGVSGEDLQTLHAAALLHDLGKLALPEAILLKPAALSLEEREIVRQHPGIAAAALQSVPGLEGPAGLLVAANEWFDGRGYPGALKGDAIPLGSRIIAVADAFDAMTRRQIFRDAMAASDATREILRCTNSQFDPAVVSALLELLGDDQTH